MSSTTAASSSWSPPPRSPAQLYRGERLRLEFQRTASRLTEMQSEEYLARAHLG